MLALIQARTNSKRLSNKILRELFGKPIIKHVIDRVKKSKRVKKIIVVTPTYNEEENVYSAYSTIKELFNKINKYEYKHLFIDNCSTDKTQNIIRKITKDDKNILAIFNRQNYGQNRSPFYAITQCYSDAVIYIDCDLQDPPEKILEFIKEWENGSNLVLGVKKSSKERKVQLLLHPPPLLR